MQKHPVQQKGRLKGYISKELGVRASAVIMTDLVDDLCRLQFTSPSSSVALGRLLVGSVLVASQMKDGHAISFQVSGSKSIKKIFAHAQYDGLCRGYISEKQAPLSLDKSNLSLKPLIGSGTLQAVTYIPNHKSPHMTQLELVSGEIGEDIAYYLNQSQQIPCLVSLSVKIGKEGRVLAAGGVLVELMPGHSEDTLRFIESRQKLAKPLSLLIESEHSHSELLKNYLGEINMVEIKGHEVTYGCTCSREKASSSLCMLDAKDFDEIIGSQEGLSVDCEMCGQIYVFDTEEMNMIFKQSGKADVH